MTDPSAPAPAPAPAAAASPEPAPVVRAALRAPADAARVALACLDLTSLRGDEADADLDRLADRAAHPAGSPAALCVFARYLPGLRERLAARGRDRLPLATVVAFPQGDASPQRLADEIGAAIEAGADELDVVLPWRALRAAADGAPLHGLDRAAAEAAVSAAVAAARAACGDRPLKAIVESGALGDPGLVARAARLALDAGADFVKTSTGRAAVHVTPTAVAALLGELVGAAARGRAAGLKVSAGLQTLDDVRGYLAQVDAVLGPPAAVPQRLRFGASSLWPVLVAALDPAAPGDAAGPRR